MSTFEEIGIQKAYIKALKELHIKAPTEIQEKAISILLKKPTDFIGLAQTGTGKTAAFGLPLLHQINTENTRVQGLILAPTRELVQQIKKQLFKFTKYSESKIFAEGVYGGEKIDKQIKALKRTTHIVVATPGRLIDLIDKKAIDIEHIKTLILDEADEMLSMGFKQDLDRILKTTKGTRHTWLFSATMPEEIKRIVNVYMDDNAIKVEVNKNALVNANITHEYIITGLLEKPNTLFKLLMGRGDQRGIIFCRTKAGTQSLSKALVREGFSVGALEGDMQQKERDKVMRAFKKENLQILVSTDVSARGIDVSDLAFVIQKWSYRTGRKNGKFHRTCAS